ncbi:MAG: hypothetical protein RBQ97_08695 [Acholeplasma sp.]|nr:hypothetical protein [Acholeplasma sp.]
MLEKGTNTRILQSFTLVVLIFIIQNTKFTSKYIKFLINIIGYTILIAMIVTIIQVFNFEFLNANYLWNQDKALTKGALDIYNIRRNSIFGYIDPNELGLSFFPLLSVFIGHKLKNKDNRFLLLFVFAGGVIAFFSNTRYVMVAYIIVILQVLVYRRTTMLATIKALLLIGFVSIALYFVIIEMGYDIGDWADQRLFREGTFRESTRFLALQNFLIFFPQNFLFGYGYLTNSLQIASNSIGSSQIHVGYLSALVYFGLVGCFFLFGLWFLLFKSLYKTAKATNYWGSFFAFLVFLWANLTLVMFSLFYYGILIAIVFDKYYKDSHVSLAVKKSNTDT